MDPSLVLARRMLPHRRQPAGLPPGQRLVRAFPRFGIDPRRLPLPLADRPTISVHFLGDHIAEIGPEDLATARVDVTADFHCVTTWSVTGLRWSGGRFVDLWERWQVDHPALAEVSHIRIHGADGHGSVMALGDALADDVLLADRLDGEPLDLRHGAPYRFVAPRHYGYKNTKHVTRIELHRARPETPLGRLEHPRGRVANEERHARLPAWLVRWPYRLTVAPTAMLAERALGKAERSDRADTSSATALT